MLNKKRQELIIQNLKSISSQVRLMSVEQLLNFPSMPPQEKIKYLEPCLQDTEESVQNAARIAIGKLGGKASPSFAAPSMEQPQNQFTTPAPQEAPSNNSSDFELPSLFDLSSDSQPANTETNNLSNVNNNQPFINNPLNETNEDLNSKLPDLSSLLGEPSNTGLPNIPKANPSQPANLANGNFQSNPTQKPSFVLPNSAPQVQNPAQSQIAAPRPPLPPNYTGTIPTPSVVPPTPSVMPPIQPVVPQNPPAVSPIPTAQQSSKASNIIDEEVDPSLPQITNATDIAFLIQHIKEIANSKPKGFLTRLFELAKSVHEEVALTALQTLFNIKDQRVPSHILALLNDPTYTSQRRFLMLKIVMETDCSLNADLLENILVNEKDVIIKSGLVKVFAKNCNQNGIPLLIKCLNDEDPRVRANTVEVIESQHITGCEQEIIKLLNDSENRVKVNAAKYLVKIGYQQAFFTLRAMLVSPEVWLRDSVIFALGEIADQSSLILLRAALKDPNQGIRLSVLKSLARINNNMARQILKAACGDPDPIVAQVAVSLFEKIKNTPVSEDKATPVNNNIPAAKPPIQNMNPVAKSPIPPSIPNVPQQQPVHSQPNIPTNPGILGNMPPQNSGNTAPNVPAAPQNMPAASQNKAPFQSAPVTGNNNGLPDLNNLVTPTAAPQQPQVTVPQPQVITPQQQVTAPHPQVTTPNLGNVSPTATPTINRNPVMGNRPAGPKPLPPVRPVMPVRRPQQNTVVAPTLPPGSPNFEKPRSAAIYAKLCSSSVDEQRSGMKDVAFVMGQDQMILLAKAIKLEDESIRITAVKLLSRKRTPDAKEMLVVLSQDTNETVSSLAKKALMIMR